MADLIIHDEGISHLPELKKGQFQTTVTLGHSRDLQRYGVDFNIAEDGDAGIVPVSQLFISSDDLPYLINFFTLALEDAKKTNEEEKKPF